MSTEEWARAAAKEISTYVNRPDNVWSTVGVMDIIAAHAEPLVAALTQWRSWAQFVWRYGGPVSADDATLQASICERYDALVALLRESKREGHGIDDEGDPCEKVNYLDGLHACTCGADAWNARVDAVLNGAK